MSEGLYVVRSKSSPPMFLARERSQRTGRRLLCDVPEDIATFKRKASAQGQALRAGGAADGFDVVTLRYAIGWMRAACEVGTDDLKLTRADKKAFKRLRDADRRARSK